MSGLYRLFLSSIATRGRVIGLVALGAVTVIVGLAIGASDVSDHLDDGTIMISNLGLSPPVGTDQHDHNTLTFTQPLQRWQQTRLEVGDLRR